MASTFLLLAAYLLTQNMPLAVALGVTFGVVQIGWKYVRKRPIGTMQYLNLFLVVASGAATLITRDPRFVMMKPSFIYVVIGIVMLRPGWQNRYLPPVAMEVVPDIAFAFGFAWAGLMFVSAALNVVLALNVGMVAWSESMSLFGTVSKIALFLAQYATMRTVGIRRRARTVQATG